MSSNDIIIGLGFGDEGKGTIVDYLCSQQETNAVIRFSGGSQAAHNVVTPSGQHHTFSQLGSGSFHRVRTILSRYMMVQPFSLIKEAEAFYYGTGFDALEPMLISEHSLLTTPLHAAVNQKREINRGAAAHGSVGLGIGETQNYLNHVGVNAPRMGDLKNLELLFNKLDMLSAWAKEQVGDITDLTPSLNSLKASYAALQIDGMLNIVPDQVILDELRKGYNVFEGSQGVLLDEKYGFHPNTTWSTVTAANAQTLLKEARLESGRVIGITRTYGTRHGAGPFPSEFAGKQWSENFLEAHNKTGRFEGAWRAGYLDIPLLSYGAKACGGVDVLAVTHLDVPTTHVVIGYEDFNGVPTDFFNGDREKQEEFNKHLGQLNSKRQLKEITSEEEILRLISQVCNAPVAIKSYGKTWVDKVAL